MPPLLIAAAVTGLGVLGLSVFEQFDPAGSPIGWLIFLCLAAAHWRLWRPKVTADRSTAVPFPIPPKWLYVIALFLVFIATAVLATSHNVRIFEEPVLPKRSAQLGMMTQTVYRMQEGQALYARSYPRDGYREANPFLAGLTIPYLTARTLGFEWRYASLAGVILTGALLCMALLALANSRWKPSDEAIPALAAFGIVLAGAAWWFREDTLNFLQWGHTAPMWPLLAALGIFIALRWYPAAALAAGCLAAMSPGWLLLLPVVAIFLWRERPAFSWIPLLLLPPLFSLAFARYQMEDMVTGVLGAHFREGGNLADHATAWRFATVHGLTDFLAMRPAVYTTALIILIGASIRIYKSETRHERLCLLALSAFVVVACAPVAYYFHWAGHAILLAGLVPAACLAYAEEEQPAHDGTPLVLPLRTPEALLFAGAAGVLSIFSWMPLRDGVHDDITRRPDFSQKPNERLYMGWNVTSGDHTWGSGTGMATGFVLESRAPGLLEMRIGTLGGEFTAYNPFVVRVNGIPKARYFLLPGETRYVQVPLDKKDVHIGINVVELEAAWARTPRSAGVAPDDRTVSLMYQGLRFIPAALLPQEETAQAIATQTYRQSIPDP